MNVPPKRFPITIDGETTEIGTANELALALDVLQGQHDRAVLEQLAPHLVDIIQTPVGFTSVLRSLSTQDQLFLIQAIGPKLLDVIQEVRFLRDLFATLAEEQVEECLLDTLGTPGLGALILTGEELAHVLEWLYGQCDRRVIDLLGPAKIRRIIRNADQLGLVLNSLDEAGQLNLLDLLGWEHVAGLASDGKDLAYLLRALPSVHSARLLEHYTREQLINLIGNQHDWVYLYDRLEPAEAHNLLAKLGAPQNAA